MSIFNHFGAFASGQLCRITSQKPSISDISGICKEMETLP